MAAFRSWAGSGLEVDITRGAELLSSGLSADDTDIGLPSGQP